MALQGVMLFVKDLARMTEFYRDVLRLQPIEATRLDNWVEFEGDGGRFQLHAIPPPAGGDGGGRAIDSPPRPREQGGVKLTFAVRDVASTLETISAMGLPLLARPWGDTDAVDPEGNVFGLQRIA